MVKKIILLVLLAAPLFGNAQEKRAADIYDASTSYEYPTDPLVRKKLDAWQDLKFGVIIHFGLYSVGGIRESWLLCNEPRFVRDSTIAYDDYKKWYWGQSQKFNPVKFDPDKWAEISQKAGMKYVIFTTKHHEGFSMFDTKQSDFKITNTPFGKNPKSDITKAVFDAYRKKGMMIGAYFSKPDWHSEYFWWPRYATPDRNVNYDGIKNPWRWQKFKDFTYNQIGELMHNYGKIDILWLDGGWVRPLEPNKKRAEGFTLYPDFSQDVNMPKIAAMSRIAQPGILVVDRTVHGPYENYRTPEQAVPKEQIKEPWETCMTLGKAWGYREGDKMKSAEKIIHTLAEVVAKGGSLLLGIGPDGMGEFPVASINPLTSIGAWLKVNGEAIYGTRITENYNDGLTWFTQAKDGKTKYAIACIKEDSTVPTTIQWKGNIPGKGTKIKLLATGKNVNWKQAGDEVVVTVPAELIGKKTAALAFAFYAK
ncbi:alpha-L-fucosidase [Pedobacter psychrodurus]|uniref:alpha-L-fucosidase n=1 Tax=Pedobacter psychrodurus TaxID=2530456 RepID=UPI00292E1293|nr:alpha-L-fucosidase [Pedobacter psychrodurus]